jgi:hypothetical protein
MVALFSGTGRIRLTFDSRSLENESRHCWHPAVLTD